jgi:hypothetical protein
MENITLEGIPKDFWDDVVIPDPKKLGDAITHNRQIDNNLLSGFESILPIPLFNSIKHGKYIGVRGNGLCGIYSILAEIIQTNTSFSNMNHDLLMEQITPIMEEYGIHDRPSAIDADVLCNIMRVYIKNYLQDDIQHPSFAIFSLSDLTVKFDVTNESRCYMGNLITIVYNYGHFEGLIYSQKQKKKIYMGLQKFLENK